MPTSQRGRGDTMSSPPSSRFHRHWTARGGAIYNIEAVYLYIDCRFTATDCPELLFLFYFKITAFMARSKKFFLQRRNSVATLMENKYFLS